MFRNVYDTDVTTFSPAGRLHQVEYAMEAVKQGSAVVGLRSKDYALLAALKRSPSDLGSYLSKIFKIDDHIGIGVSGLIADGRVLCEWMRTECLNHKYIFESPMPSSRLVNALSDKSQVYTQKYEKRPYGVGFLVIGADQTGPHLYQTVPSGTYFEYKAQAMGARSQGAKTYLESKFESFEEMSLSDLIFQALTALKSTSATPLTTRNCTVAYVGTERPLTILDGNDLKEHVARIDTAPVVAPSGGGGKGSDGDKDKDGDTSMTT